MLEWMWVYTSVGLVASGVADWLWARRVADHTQFAVVLCGEGGSEAALCRYFIGHKRCISGMIRMQDFPVANVLPPLLCLSNSSSPPLVCGRDGV
jgi:hypothetical protein